MKRITVLPTTAKKPLVICQTMRKGNKLAATPAWAPQVCYLNFIIFWRESYRR